MRLLYTLLFYALIPLILLRLLWRSRHNPAYRARWAERFGRIPALKTDKIVVWLHTVSVGEFQGALPLIYPLLARQDLTLVITTTTVAGSERVQKNLGDRVLHYYMPYDLPAALERFMARLRPAILLIMETELWPNTLAVCAKHNIKTVLFNARLSEKSARGYARINTLTQSMLQQIHHVCAQHTEDAERFCALGLAAEKVTVTGSIKFDITLGAALQSQAQSLKQLWSLGGTRRIWIAASTHKGEDEIILSALARLRSGGIGPEQLLLVLVPRHPERFEAMAGLVTGRGFSCARRSQQGAPRAQTDVLLGDTMGELLLLYGASDMAFMGGSLVPVGGHNFVEPAAWGLPLSSGPLLHNFATISRLLQEAGALTITADAEAIAAVVRQWLQEPELRRTMGAAAFTVAEENRGALGRTLAEIERVMAG